MIGVAVVLAALTGVVLAVSWIVAREARRLDVMRDDVLGTPLHPALWRAVVDQPRGEHVRVLGPAPYDWAQDSQGDDSGDT